MYIIKRDGKKEEFNKEKISNAIYKSMVDAGEVNEDARIKITNTVSEKILSDKDKEYTVEEIQDMVEESLMNNLCIKAAKRYIIYRNKRNEIRNKPWVMTELQESMYNNKYRFENESFNEMINRVSGGDLKLAKLIRDKKFIFGGRILANRGLQYKGKKVTYSNCYVLKAPEDNLESIYECASKMARTFSYGGGVGVNIGKLRPAGAVVNNAAKTTSGAVSFMELYDLTTRLIAQHGRRG